MICNNVACQSLSYNKFIKVYLWQSLTSIIIGNDQFLLELPLFLNLQPTLFFFLELVTYIIDGLHLFWFLFFPLRLVIKPAIGFLSLYLKFCLKTAFVINLSISFNISSILTLMKTWLALIFFFCSFFSPPRNLQATSPLATMNFNLHFLFLHFVTFTNSTHCDHKNFAFILALFSFFVGFWQFIF